MTRNLAFKWACLLGMVCWAGAMAWGQTLPPLGRNPLPVPDSRLIVVGSDAEERAQAAIDDFLRGDVTRALEQLATSDFVVDLEQGLAADALPSHDLTLARALSSFARGDLRRTYDTATALLATPGIEWHRHRQGAQMLLAFTFLRAEVFPLAAQHAAQAVNLLAPDPFAGHRIAKMLEESGARDFDSEGILPAIHGDVEAFRSRVTSREPWVAVWFGTQNAFVGALTVTDLNFGSGRQPHYCLVYRDLDAPPITLLDLGDKLPPTSELHRFATGFSTQPWSAPGGLLRIQMEATWFHRAGLSPLAALWCREAEYDPLLRKQIVEPLVDSFNWDWQFAFRCHLGPGMPPDYEMAVFVNRVTSAGIGGPDTFYKYVLERPVPLEHYYVVLATRTDRCLVAVYRVVSEPMRDKNRLYQLQRVQGENISVLQVSSELPDVHDVSRQVSQWHDDAKAEGSADGGRLMLNELDTTGGPISGERLVAFLAEQGMTLTDVAPRTEVQVRAKVRIVDGNEMFSNQFCQTGTGATGGFTLRFEKPLSSFLVERDIVQPKAFPGATVNNTRQGAWQITALDSAGRVVDRFSEGDQVLSDDLVSTRINVGLPTLLLHGPRIVAVRIENRLNDEWVWWGEISLGFAP